jgi:hypothetical protein
LFLRLLFLICLLLLPLLFDCLVTFTIEVPPLSQLDFAVPLKKNPTPCASSKKLYMEIQSSYWFSGIHQTFFCRRTFLVVYFPFFTCFLSFTVLLCHRYSSSNHLLILAEIICLHISLMSPCPPNFFTF